ncbi:hypothetical protein MTO96_020717 [Rhipicephalus appendiculatus]
MTQRRCSQRAGPTRIPRRVAITRRDWFVAEIPFLRLRRGATGGCTKCDSEQEDTSLAGAALSSSFAETPEGTGPEKEVDKDLIYFLFRSSLASISSLFSVSLQ